MDESVKAVLADGDLVAVYAHRPVPGTDLGVAVVDIYRVADRAVSARWTVTRAVRGSVDEFDGVDRRTPTDPATRSANRELVDRMQRVLFIEHRVDEALDAYFGPDRYRQHAPGAADGVAFIREGFRQRFREHPRATSRLLHLIAEDDLVLTHRRSRLGPDHPLRAVCDIYRIEDGRIVEHWDVTEHLVAS